MFFTNYKTKKMKKKVNVKASKEYLKKIKDLDIKQYSGKIHKKTYLEVALDFSDAGSLASNITDGNNFGDWLSYKGWPKGYIPLAMYNPIDKKQESIFWDVSESIAEEFLAIDQNDPNFPVYGWCNDAGFEKWYDSIEDFLGEFK